MYEIFLQTLKDEVATIRPKHSRHYHCSCQHLSRQRYASWYCNSTGIDYYQAPSDSLQTIFFGANDAVLPDSPTHQHVPLQEYKQNLRSLITHETIEAHQPRIILITPGPVDEYQFFVRQRTAEHTKLYADACREIGKELGVPVLDLWSVLMAEAGWREGEPLPGSIKTERNKVLGELLHDGMRTLHGYMTSQKPWRLNLA